MRGTPIATSRTEKPVGGGHRLVISTPRMHPTEG